MTGLEKILLTSACTVIGGTTVYVSGQIIIKFVIEPIHEQKRTVGEIIDALDYYENVYSCRSGLFEVWTLREQQSKEEKAEEASKRFRQLATVLKAKTHLIPRYAILSRIGFVHRHKDIFEVCAQLVDLSNSCRKSSSEVFVNTEHRVGLADRVRGILGVL